MKPRTPYARPLRLWDQVREQTRSRQYSLISVKTCLCGVKLRRVEDTSVAHIFKRFRALAGIEYTLSAIEFIVFDNAPIRPARRVMGLKKRRLSRSGAASHAIIATKDQQLGKPCTVR